MPQDDCTPELIKAATRMKDELTSSGQDCQNVSSNKDIIVPTKGNGNDPFQGGKVTFLSRGKHHIIALKPPSVMCHHSTWIGTRRKKSKQNEIPEIPMLQRVRDAIHSIDTENDTGNDSVKRRVNLVHRLDRGASGALLLAFADEDDNDVNDNDDIIYDYAESELKKGPTATLSAAMSQPTATKTYIALVRGEGILKGENLIEKGWFEVNRPIKDKKGKLHDATTCFRFVAGQKADETCPVNRPRMSLVLARPHQGRWHQIRRHLNGLSHHIIGDGCHGDSKTNKEWKENRSLPHERILLHLSRLQIPPTSFTPEGIDCLCPLADDMKDILESYAPDLLEEALPVLHIEGIRLDCDESNFTSGNFKIPINH